MSKGREARIHGNSGDRKRGPRGTRGREAWAGGLQADVRASSACWGLLPGDRHLLPSPDCPLERQPGAVVQLHKSGASGRVRSLSRKKEAAALSPCQPVCQAACVACRPGERAFGSVWAVTPRLL